MERDSLKKYCLSKKGASETFPFGNQAAVYKIANKMFALINLEESPTKITLKCDPVIAEMLREQYEAVQPGYYMNKKHWNTIEMNGTILDDEILKMIDASYDLVFKGLKKVEKEEIVRL